MKVNSWDCFDTLIGRNLIKPQSIFNIVGERIGDPNFTEKRIRAEKINGSTYEEIYQNLPGIDKNLELEEELKNCYPIVENMKKVKDGDYIISDMYLPKDFIHEMLKKCGLNKDVKIIVSKNGKHNGKIWKELRNNINEHTGDNIISDVKNPLLQGIKANFFLEQEMNPPEKDLWEINKSLCGFSRKLRLINPNFYAEEKWIHSKGFFKKTYGNHWYEQLNINLKKSAPLPIFHFKEISRTEDCVILEKQGVRWGKMYVKLCKNHSEIKYNSLYNKLYDGHWVNDYPINAYDYKTIWQEQANLNIPALILGANLLKKQYGNHKLIFNFRDCYFLKKIYEELFNAQTDYIDASRILFHNPNEEYIKYLKNKLGKDQILIDLHGSGVSSWSCLDSNNINIRKMIFIYSHDHKHKPNDTDKFCYGSEIYGRIEKFNFYDKGTLIDWRNGPIRSRLEYPLEFFNLQHELINLCFSEVNNFKINFLQNESPQFLGNSLSYILKYLENSYTANVVPNGPSRQLIMAKGRDYFKLK